MGFMNKLFGKKQEAAGGFHNVQKALAVLEDAYLVRDNEKLEKNVNDALDLIAAKGDSGINVLLERLYRGMRTDGPALVVKSLGDMAWNEWLKKRCIVDALGRARAQSAIERLIPLLHARSTDSQFHSILQPAVANTLGAIGDERAIEALRKALDDPSTRPMTKRAAANALMKLGEEVRVTEPSVKAPVQKAVHPACSICGRDMTGQPVMADRLTGATYCSNDSEYLDSLKNPDSLSTCGSCGFKYSKAYSKFATGDNPKCPRCVGGLLPRA